MPRPHPPLLNRLSGAEYLRHQQSFQQKVYETLVASLPHDCFQFLMEHLEPTAQVAPFPNRGNSDEAFQSSEEDSVAVPQSPHQPDCPGHSDISTGSEGGRPVLNFTPCEQDTVGRSPHQPDCPGQSDISTESEDGRPVVNFTPCEQDTVEKSPESESVKTELLEIQPETINTRSSIYIKGFDNNRLFCYQNSVIQMLCASDSLRVKFLDHLDAMDSAFQSINFEGTYPFTVPSCCVDEMCLLCALGWVMVNHRFHGPIGVNTTPLNHWVSDLRILSSGI